MSDESKKVPSEKVKVLYIAGTMRSGSTLLGRLLAELPTVTNVGELGLLFQPYFGERARCECLQKVYECDFWRAVFERAFGGIDHLDIAALHETKQAYRMRTLPRFLLGYQSSCHDARLREYIQVLDALYRAVAEISGARVVVDASKDPLFAHLLHRAPSLDLRVVHLVRDSRAVAYSQQRIKADPPLFSSPTRLPVVSPVVTALAWNAVNALLSLKKTGSYSAFLRYEDFAASPEAALRRLWGLMDEPLPALDFLEQPTLRLHTNHTVAGNPDRFRSEVTIRPDLEWRLKMSPQTQRLVTVLTFPLLMHYGYLRSASPEKEHARSQPTVV